MAAKEQAFPAGSAIAIGGGSVITSPFQFVADADTFLRVASICSAGNVVLAVQGRRLDDRGQIQPIVETHTPLSTRTRKTQDYGLGQGAILNLTVFASQGTPLIGQCYVMVQLLRNFGGTAIVLGTLLGGYATAAQALGFPGSPIQSSTEGEPVVRNILGTLPAPGVSINEVCPAGARWELVSVKTILTTSAVAGSRAPFFEFIAGGQDCGVTVAQPSSDQGPGSAFHWTFAQNLIDGLVNGVGQIPFPQRQFLQAGDSFTVGAFGIDAADQWDRPKYQVREWLEVN